MRAATPLTSAMDPFGGLGAATKLTTARLPRGSARGRAAKRTRPSAVRVSPSRAASRRWTSSREGFSKLSLTRICPSRSTRRISAADRRAARPSSSARSSVAVAPSRAASVAESASARSVDASSPVAWSWEMPSTAITRAVVMPTTTTMAGARGRSGSTARGDVEKTRATDSAPLG